MFLASKKKIEFLKPLETNLDSSGTVPNIKLLTREKDDHDKKNFAKLMDAIKASKNGKTIGTFAKDKFPGPFMELWREALKKAAFESLDVSNIFGIIMAPKEESEISIVKKAAGLSSDIFSKYLKVREARSFLGFEVCWGSKCAGVRSLLGFEVCCLAGVRSLLGFEVCCLAGVRSLLGLEVC